MKKLNFVLSICLVLGPGWLSILFGAITLIESTPKRITIKYTPSPPQIRLLEPDYQLIQLDRCAFTDSVGKMMLPVRKITLAIPPNATINTRLVSSPPEKLRPLNCPPVPSRHATSANLDFREIHYIKDPLKFSTNAFQPATVFHVSEPAWLRHQQVIEISFFPIQVNPVTNEARFFPEITLELNFDSTTSQSDSSPEQLFEPVYERSLLNYRQGLNWRVSPAKINKLSGQILTGKWFRIKIRETGFYKIDREFLLMQGMAVDEIELDKIKIFNGSGRELSIELLEPEPELQEIAIEIVDHNQNNRFDADDYLLFFGRGTTRWKESVIFGASRHLRHAYSDENVYWLKFGKTPGKRVAWQKKIQQSGPFKPIQTTTARLFEENEKWLMRNSGTIWIWDQLRERTSREYQFSLDEWLADSTMIMKLHFFGNSSVHNLIDLQLNDLPLETLDLPYTLSRTFSLPIGEQVATGRNRLKMTLTQPNSDIFFDWLEVHYWQNLSASANQLEFSSSGNAGFVEFQISNITTPEISVYNLTDPFSITKMRVFLDTSQFQISIRDSIPSGTVRRYELLDSNAFRLPSSLELFELAPGQDLRCSTNQANYLIITANELLGPEIEKFAVHRRDPRYWPYTETAHIKIVTTAQIYDQFAWGLTDPVAIRNFLKFAFENWTVPPAYVLFAGDANYDFKNHYQLNQPLLVPSYSVGEKVTDDWFAYLTRDRKLDLMTGRLPVKNREELEVVVNKIIQYDTNPPTGTWANQVLMIADDDFQKQNYTPADAEFILDSEKILQSNPTAFDISKIYLKYFPWDRSFNKPAAKTKLIEKINEGVLFINYLGHANWNVLSHEGLFSAFTDFAELKNGDRLPLFFAGTCEVSLFDDPHLVSLGERFILKENGGVIAMIASARWNVHHASQLLNAYFYQDIFSKAGATIGEILTAGKTKVGFPDQMELVFLFGDPAQQLRAPSHQIQFAVSPDTLDLHHRMTLQGQILDNGVLFEAFNGSCAVKIYDSAFATKYYEYPVILPGAPVFNGEVAVTAGQFKTSFFLQPQRTEGGSNGQIRLCAWEASGGFLAQGHRDSVVVKLDSLGQASRQDTLPPMSQIFLNAIPLSSTANIPVVGPDFMFSVQVADSASGIYLGTNPAWQMQLQLDQNPVPDFEVASHFQVEASGSTAGKLEYQFKNVAEGLHEIEFHVWDNALNQTALSVQLRVVPHKLHITNLLCHPNPATRNTWFTFISTHEIAYQLKIYTVAGRLIRQFQGIGTVDFNAVPADGWDLRDEAGDRLANGVYFFKLKASKLETQNFSSGNQNISEIGKIIIMR